MIRFISRLHLQGNFTEMMNRYKQLLTYIKTAVTRNYSEKSINSILDYISTSKQVMPDHSVNVAFVAVLIASFALYLCDKKLRYVLLSKGFFADLDGTPAELLRDDP